MNIVVFICIGTLILLLLTRVAKIAAEGLKPDRIAIASALLIGVMVLSVPSAYNLVDGLLDGFNLANLLSHLSIYCIFWILGIQVASAFQLERAKQLVSGPVNWALTVLVVVATLTAFAASSLPHSSMGLFDFQNQPTVQAYNVLSRLYPAIIAGFLLAGGCWKTLWRIPLPMLRLSAILILAGLVLVVPTPVARLLRPESAWAGSVEDFCVYVSASLVALGSTVTWFSRRLMKKPAEPLANR